MALITLDSIFFRWSDSDRVRLFGLWALINQAVQYEPGSITKECADVFGSDPINFPLMKEIVRKNPSAKKILLKQECDILQNQNMADIQKIMTISKNPVLVVAPGSNFTVVLCDTEDGNMEVWIWDLRKLNP